MCDNLKVFTVWSKSWGNWHLRILYFPDEYQWWAKTNNLFHFQLGAKARFDYIIEAKIFIQILLWTESRQIQVGDIEEYNGEDNILASHPEC